MTKIQCKNISGNIIWYLNKYIVMEASARFTCFKLLTQKRYTTSHFLTHTQEYCICLVKTISNNWDHFCNIWFLSSCAKYTNTKQKKETATTSIHKTAKFGQRHHLSKTSTTTSETTINNRHFSAPRHLFLPPTCSTTFEHWHTPLATNRCALVRRWRKAVCTDHTSFG